jgi:DNA-binding MarR family transcriptional regulator
MNDTTARFRSHIQDVVSSWERERPDLDLSNFLLSICVMRLGRIVDDAYDRMCRKRYGISGADMRVLFALRRAGKPYARRPTDLFRALLVTSGAITKQVDRLSRLDFVDRMDDPTYTGGVLIALTAKGLRASNSAAEWLTENSPIAPGVAQMTASERAAGRRFIQRVLESLEQAQALEGGARPRVKSAKTPRRRAARSAA